uniref:CE295 protein n=1 Tax=Panagrellus redivivus TaxID=6233 RepID=A0A7E4ZZC6_PANRE
MDDQVTILLNSMRVRVEDEENTRQRRKLQAAKKKAQKWLAEAKSHSEAIQSVPEKASMKSNPIPLIGNTRLPPGKQLCQRAASYQFLPEIVVTGSQVEQQNYHAQKAAMQPQPLTHSRSYSRVPSTPSIDETSTDSNPNGCKEEVFSVV